MEVVPAPRAGRIPPGAIALRKCKGGGPPDFLVLTDRPDADQAIALPEGDTFSLLPQLAPAVASHLHLAAPSGAGKSTWLKEYADLFREVLGGLVYLISADGKQDPSFPDPDVRVQIDESLGGTPLESIRPDDHNGVPLDAARPLLLVFDDIEGLPKALQSSVDTFATAARERGRKLGIHTASAFHRGAAGKSTKSSLGEATGFVVWPSRMTSNTAYMLKNYADLDPEIVSLIKRSDWGRWLVVQPGAFLLGEKKAAIIDAPVLSAIGKAERKRMAAAATEALSEAAQVASPETAAVKMKRLAASAAPDARSGEISEENLGDYIRELLARE